jgi:riboflavin synthase
MFTGIVQGMATVAVSAEFPGLRRFTLQFPQGFGQGLALGASVAVDGVCLTVTHLHEEGKAVIAADFDVMQQSLAVTTLSLLQPGSHINVERAAAEGAEIGGHPLSGHVDFTATLQSLRQPENNHVLRVAVPAPWMRYIFPKGYIALDGASLTVAEARRERDGSGTFDVWLIPETLRMTTFGHKRVGDSFNVEIDRQTQVFVDTVREAIDERLGPLLPALEQLLASQGKTVDDLANPGSAS